MPVSAVSGTDLVTLLPSTTVTTGTAVTTNAIPIYGMRIGIDFVLDVTALATTSGDKLDVFVQAMVEGSTSAGTDVWLDVVHFTQLLGNGSAARIIAKFVGNASESMYDMSSTLAAGSVKTFCGDKYRVKYTVTNSSSPSFTFSVTALPF